MLLPNDIGHTNACFVRESYQYVRVETSSKVLSIVQHSLQSTLPSLANIFANELFTTINDKVVLNSTTRT
jgi:hypothetical protein